MIELNCNFDGGTYMENDSKFGYWGYVFYYNDDKPFFTESFVENSSSKPKEFLYSHIPGSKFPLFVV